jgi:cephalosporin hydroxylase
MKNDNLKRWIRKNFRAKGFYITGLLLNFPPYRRWITNQFHKLVYGSFILKQPWTMTDWLGISVLKCPFDLWIYQELIYEIQPDILIDCGSHLGGSAFFFASLCELMGKGKVISIDIESQEQCIKHDRITYLHGSSIDPNVLTQIQSLINQGNAVMVWLDSNHEEEYVLQEMNLYSQFVSKESYLIVEDTNLNGNPVWWGFGSGPAEAVKKFLAQTDDFKVDRECERYYLSFNPGGYLKRIK